VTCSTPIPRLQAAILKDAGVLLIAGMRVLDLGCGNGNVVRGWLDMGFDAYGCDFRFKPGPEVETLVQSGRLASIGTHPYHLPYPDSHFDLLLTNQVMEHVSDYEATLAEIHRVLKPHRYCLHIFPARLMPIEPHIYVPLAAVIQSWPWLALWARLGVRKEDQHGLTWREVVDRNQKYLSDRTNYLPGTMIEKHFLRYFENFCYKESAFLRYSPNRRGRIFYKIGCIFPVLFFVYRVFWSRIIIAQS
jgi:SAM-dependent methyltransferase